jgi:uncharacterized protein YciI
MPYIIETFYKPGHEQVRNDHRPSHLVFLEQQKKRLLACGAKLKDDGSDGGGAFYIVDVDTRAEAEAFIAADPYSRAEIIQTINLTRWRKAYIDGLSYL